jgi:DNA-binding transcriptional MocR family regulator
MAEQIVTARALYERRAALTGEALARHMPDGTTWTKPEGGFYYWLTAPAGLDTVTLSAAAREKKVAYVPGRPFYPDDEGHAQIRISYSRVDDELIDEGIRRIGEVLKTALEAT